MECTDQVFRSGGIRSENCDGEIVRFDTVGMRVWLKHQRGLHVRRY